MKPVCLVIGAGAGIGGNVAKKFATEGYHSVLCRRTDQEGLDRMVSEIESSGGSASGYLLNAVDENSIEERITEIEKNVGGIDTVIFNLGAQIGDRSLENTSYKALRWAGVWRVSRYFGRPQRSVPTWKSAVRAAF